jgi:hypothetical protein
MPLAFKQVAIILFLIVNSSLFIWELFENFLIYIHLTLLAIVLFFGFMATIVDPTDKAIYFQRKYKDDQKKMLLAKNNLKYEC